MTPARAAAPGPVQVEQAPDRLDRGGVLTIDLGAVSFLDSWGTLPLEAALAGATRRSATLMLARPTARSLLMLRILGWDVVVTATDDPPLHRRPFGWRERPPGPVLNPEV